MYVSTNPKAELKKKKRRSVLPCLNVSSPCSQHSDVQDFLITVFQSTSYEFVLVQHVSNPMVSDHRSYLVLFPLVLNWRVKKIKWAYLHGRLWEVNSIGNTFPKVAEPVKFADRYQAILFAYYLRELRGKQCYQKWMEISGNCLCCIEYHRWPRQVACSRGCQRVTTSSAFWASGLEISDFNTR